MERCRMVFSGSGGQGVITAAIILAEAAVIYENLRAVQSQTYGPAARGGAARSDVIISDSDINYPRVMQPNVLVCLTQEAYNKFNRIIRPGCLLITDSHFVDHDRKVDARQKGLPMYDAVMENIGKPVVFNICMLGAVLEFTNLVEADSIIKVLESRLPKEFLAINKKALEIGMGLAAAEKSS